MNYDKEKLKIVTWKNPVMLHWILNPALFINELILGQTFPKVTLIDKVYDRRYSRRTYIPCPHCGMVHDGIKWSVQNGTAFKNWFGYYCDNCGEIIPVQRNLISWLILIMTFPVWGWFKKSMKKSWFEKQPERFKNLNLEYPVEKAYRYVWFKMGLIFGICMYVTTIFIIPMISNEVITVRKILIGIPIWLFIGLGYGYFMNGWMNQNYKCK
jgi:hypothetical protein